MNLGKHELTCTLLVEAGKREKLIFLPFVQQWVKHLKKKKKKVCIVLNELVVLTWEKNFKLNCKKKQVGGMLFSHVIWKRVGGSGKVIYGGGVSEVCMFYQLCILSYLCFQNPEIDATCWLMMKKNICTAVLKRKKEKQQSTDELPEALNFVWKNKDCQAFNLYSTYQ